MNTSFEPAVFEPAVIHHGLVQSDEGPEAGHRVPLHDHVLLTPSRRRSRIPPTLTGAGQLRTVEVRAHGLQDALRKAAELPVQTWFEADGEAPILPADQLR